LKKKKKKEKEKKKKKKGVYTRSSWKKRESHFPIKHFDGKKADRAVEYLD